MTAFTLVWGALTRRKLRTLFTFLSVVVTFTLFCVLAAIQQGMSGQLTIASAQRLRTHVMASRTSGLLPLSYLDKIASVPGVTAVTYDIDAIHGYFRDPKNSVRVIAFAGQAFMQVYPEFHLTPEEKYSWLSDRQGAIVGPVLARRMGWKVGDTIPIQGGPAHEDGSTTWYFHLNGIYSSELPSAYQGFFVTHYKYFDEGMANDTNKDRVFEFIERVDDPRNSARISNDIDQLFENASPQTLTQSEQLESISNVRQFGDITRMVIYV
jgi:putative ABC transport system permease protein